MNVDYVGNISVVCSHSSSQHSLSLLTEHVLYGNWLCNPHFNCWRVMRSASTLQNLAHFVYILDHIHPWVLYHKNQWNYAKKKIHPLIFKVGCSNARVFHWAPYHSSRKAPACRFLKVVIFMWALRITNSSRFWMDIKSCASGYELVSYYLRAERGCCSEQTVLFLPSAVLLPLSTMHPMVAGGWAGWTVGSSAWTVPMFLREQIVDPEARASHHWCFDRKQRTNVCCPF